MLSTKNNNNNSSLFANTGKFNSIDVDIATIGNIYNKTESDSKYSSNIDLITISGKLKYIVVDNAIAPNTTLFYSNVSIQDSINRQFYNIYLPISSEDTSFFKSNVDFNQSITVKGIIYNTELINNTINISTISGLVSNANTNILTISGVVNGHTQNINTISGLVSTSNINISTISGLVSNANINISTISGVVNSNTQNINTLTSGISVQPGISVNITGNLYFNSLQVLKAQTLYNNVISVPQYINQFL